MPLAAILGYATGVRFRRRCLARNEKVDAVLGEMTIGAILALLGLLLAFYFSHSLSVADTVKTTLLEEANALGTAFDRADYLADPGRTELQTVILEYAETRLFDNDADVFTVDGVQTFLGASIEAQAKLWPLTVKLTSDPLNPVTPALQTFISGSINEVLDAHLRRMQTLSTPISDAAQVMVLATALAALFLLGNRAGALGRVLTWRTFVFSGFLFVVMITVTDILRSEEGMVQVDDTALRATIFEMKTTLRYRN